MQRARLVGTSCKDMSRQNATSARQELVLQAEKSKGGSAQTFQGLMRYVERHRPLMILFENVDAMDDVSLGIAHVHFFNPSRIFLVVSNPHRYLQLRRH